MAATARSDGARARRTEAEGTRQWRGLASTVASSAGDTTASRTHRRISCFSAHFSRGLSPCPISICTANLATTHLIESEGLTGKKEEKGRVFLAKMSPPRHVTCGPKKPRGQEAHDRTDIGPALNL